jgi:hypothetical protein
LGGERAKHLLRHSNYNLKHRLGYLQHLSDKGGHQMNILRIWRFLPIGLFFVLSFTTGYSQEKNPATADDFLQAFDFPDVPQKDLEFIKLRFDREIEQLQVMRRYAERHLRQLIFERDIAFESFLSKQRLIELNEKRKLETTNAAKENAEFMSKFAELLLALESAGDFKIYEGFPRTEEKSSAESEKQNKSIKFEEWEFYFEPLEVQTSMVERLRSILVNYKGFQPYSGAKFCGGFHPDFCIEWNSSNNKTFRLFVCFGCHEVLFVSPDEKVSFDFSEETWKSFAQIAIATFQRQADRIKHLDQLIGH